MNRVYRVLWSEPRQAFIVAHEKAKTRGKPASTRKAVALAVFLALGAMAASPAMAATSCPGTGGSTISIAASETSTCSLATGDALTVANTGSIGGANPAVVVDGTDATSIDNSGNISAANVGAPTVIGINIIDSGTVSTITNSGIISGDHFGIRIVDLGSVGSIANNAGGTISTGPGGGGIVLFAGTSVTSGISNSGAINGGSYGIGLNSGNLTGGIVNSGTISGSRGIYLVNGSGVDDINNAGGTISASAGIHLVSSDVTGGIVNSGLITASTGIHLSSASTAGSISNSGTIAGAYNGIYLSRSSSVTGAITNDASGTIASSSGSGAAILLSSGSSVGSITNDGTISGGQSGIRLQANTGGSPTGGLGASSVTGSITNSGTIIGGSNGIYLSNSNAGNIVNSGSITGRDGAVLISGSTVGSITNEAGGTISGTGQSGLRIQNSSSISGGIVNDGTISGAQTGLYISNSSSVAGDITNSGTIQGTRGSASGTGYGIYLSGGSTVGSITNSGTIQGIGGTSSGSGYGIYVYGGNIGSIDNSGTIAGTGQSGGFGIRLVSSSTVTGGITNNAGGTISGGSTGVFVDSNSTVGSISNAGTIIGGSGPAINIQGTVTGGITNTGAINGTVSLGGATLNLNGTAGSISGAVTGGAGSVVNVNGTFTTADSFAVDTFSIASTGRLNMGHDITPATAFNNAGTLAVAAATTATITGDYTQTSTGTFQTSVTDDTTYGKLVVTGTATLPTGAKINVNVADPNFAFTATSMAGIISASTLASDGSFAVTDNSTLFNFTASKNGNAVDLALALPGSGGSTGVVNAVTSTGNSPGLGAATVLDGLVADLAGGGTANADMDSVMTALGALTTNQQVSDTVTQMLPLMAGGMTHFTFANLRGVNRVVQARLEANRGLSSGDDFAGDRKVWLKPLGSWADQKNRNGAFGYDARTYGVMLGADGELSEISRIGAAFAYTNSKVDSNSGAQTADVDSYLAALYGSRHLDENTELSWQADYAYNRNEGNRYIAFVNRTARSSYHSDSFHLGAGIGRTLPMNPKTSFTPSFRVDYTTIKENGYTETDADALNLAVDGKTTDELILAVDGKVTHALSDSFTLTANLGIGHDTHTEQASMTTSFAGGGAAFTTDGINPSSTVLRGGLGMVVNSSDAMELTARYDIEERSGYTGQTVSVKFRMPF